MRGQVQLGFVDSAKATPTVQAMPRLCIARAEEPVGVSALAIRLTFASTGGAEGGEALAAHADLFAERAQSPSAALRVKQALCRAWRSHASQLSAALLK